MRLMPLLTFFILTSASLASCNGRTVAPTSPVPANEVPTEADVAGFVDLINTQRQSRGLAPLAWDPAAADVALAHSSDMATRGFFSHVNPDGASPFDRMSAAGIEYIRAGENIAFGFTSAQSVFEAWMASPGHRGNIENAAYTHHGVGRFGTYWTHLFFTPRPS
jgi:uncharacterized protein YkwD